MSSLWARAQRWSCYMLSLDNFPSCPYCFMQSYTSSSINLSATGGLIDITLMCYEYTTPPPPPPLWPTQTNQTSWPEPRAVVHSAKPSTLQTVNRWRHNEYSCCLHPSFSYSSMAHLLTRSDQWSDCQTWCGKMNHIGPMQPLWACVKGAYLVQ